MMGISGFGWFFGAKKSLKLSCDDFIPENLYFGVNSEFSKKFFVVKENFFWDKVLVP